MRLRPVIRCCVLAGLLVLPISSRAVGLGRLTLQSGLGQALSAEIELTSIQSGELDTLTARLADQATYGRNKIDFPGALTRVRVALDQRGGRPVLKVSSTQPINEPFLDLLIELNWASGKIVREYTFLLDPPGYAATTAVDPTPAIASESLAPPTAAASASRPLTPSPAVAAPPSQAAPAPATPSSSASTPTPTPPQPSPAPAPAPESSGAATGKYGPVRRGETLGRIAAKVKPDGVTLEQMLSALYRANAQAFDGKNMNRLRAGPMLAVPKLEEATAVPHVDARKEIRVQAADWRAYRERLAASLSTSEGQPAPARQPAGGRITTAIDEKSAPPAGSDRLKLSKGGAVSGTAGAAAKAENSVASQKAVTEAHSRVADLERQLKNMQRLIELKNPAMLAQQAAAEQAKGQKGVSAPAATTSSSSGAAAPAAAGAASVTVAQTVPPMSAPATTGPATTPAAAAAKADAAKTETAKADAAKAEPAKSDASKAPSIAALDAQKSTPTATTTAAAAATQAAAPAGTPVLPSGAADAQKAKPVLKAPLAAPPESSFLDELLGSSYLLIGGATALALALLYVFLARRRRSATTKFEDSIGASTDLRTSTVFGNTGGGVVNTGDNSLVSDFSREGMGNIDTGDVDPIAEAEVYLAYGRDNQAEEILRDALTKTPDRQEIRLKLLEIYAQQNKAAAFEATASELFHATHGNGEIWAKAAQLGRTIDPENPLYASKGEVVESATPAAPHTISHGNDRLSDSSLRVAAAVEKSASETGFDFTSGPQKEVFVMPPALTPAEAARSAAAAAHTTAAPAWSAMTTPTHSPALEPTRPAAQPAFGTSTLTAPLAAAATASVAAAAAARGSAVRDRAPLDFKLDSGPQESAEPAPPTMDFVTLDGPITLTGSTTLSGPATLSGVTLASPSSDIWGEKPLATLQEKVKLPAGAGEKAAGGPESSRTAAAGGFTTAVSPATVSTLAEPEIAAAPARGPQPAGLLDLDKLDLSFDPDRKTFEDPTPSVLDGQWHDAATKLDLAKAYQEMGDVDGAREILQEVVQEGDDQQKKEAQAFLSKLRA